MSGGVYGASGEDYGVSGGVKRGCGVSGGGCGCQEIAVECQEGTVGCRKRLCVSGGVVGGGECGPWARQSLLDRQCVEENPGPQHITI